MSTVSFTDFANHSHFADEQSEKGNASDDILYFFCSSFEWATDKRKSGDSPFVPNIRCREKFPSRFGMWATFGDRRVWRRCAFCLVIIAVFYAPRANIWFRIIAIKHLQSPQRINLKKLTLSVIRCEANEQRSNVSISIPIRFAVDYFFHKKYHINSIQIDGETKEKAD